MDDPKDKRAIDDPQLNQDVNFDRKDEEDFDNSDDFHKYDDTEEPKAESPDKKENQGLNGDDDAVNTQSDFDGFINI